MSKKYGHRVWIYSVFLVIDTPQYKCLFKAKTVRN
jgi:hypothetical protein